MDRPVRQVRLWIIPIVMVTSWYLFYPNTFPPIPSPPTFCGFDLSTTQLSPSFRDLPGQFPVLWAKPPQNKDHGPSVSLLLLLFYLWFSCHQDSFLNYFQQNASSYSLDPGLIQVFWSTLRCSNTFPLNLPHVEAQILPSLSTLNTVSTVWVQNLSILFQVRSLLLDSESVVVGVIRPSLFLPSCTLALPMKRMTWFKLVIYSTFGIKIGKAIYCSHNHFLRGD